MSKLRKISQRLRYQLLRCKIPRGIFNIHRKYNGTENLKERVKIQQENEEKIM